jgi:hypothetical protein
VREVTWSPERGLETTERRFVSPTRGPRDFVPPQRVPVSFGRGRGGNEWGVKPFGQDPFEQMRTNLRNEIQREVRGKIQDAFRDALFQ